MSNQLTLEAGGGRIRSQRSTDSAGNVFHSKAERNRWQALELLQAAGEIRNLRNQAPKYQITINGVKICTWTPDASYEEGPDWHFCAEDTKGYSTELFKLKAKLMLACHNIKIRIIDANDYRT